MFKKKLQKIRKKQDNDMDADVAQQSVVIINTTLQLLVIYRYG